MTLRDVAFALGVPSGYLRGRADERAAVVGWLGGVDGWVDPKIAAGLIASGEHVKGGGSGAEEGGAGAYHGGRGDPDAPSPSTYNPNVTPAPVVVPSPAVAPSAAATVATAAASSWWWILAALAAAGGAYLVTRKKGRR